MAKKRQGASKRAANSAKAKRAVPKNGPVWYRSAEEATLDQMPKFNGFRCGTGAHGDAKYNRAKAKRTWQQQLRQEGTRDHGSLPFSRGELTGCGRRLPIRAIERLIRKARYSLKVLRPGRPMQLSR